MDFTRLFDLISYQHAKYPNTKSLCILSNSGTRSFSTAQLIKKIDQLSSALINKGYIKNDILAIFCKSGSPEWNIADFAAMQIGMTSVALHENYQEFELSYVLDEIGAKACMVSHVEYGKKLLEVGYKGFIFCIEKSSEFTNLSSLCTDFTDADQKILASRKQEVKSEDLATIVYTSGSTGMPKGVMLSHYNIVSNIKACISLIPINYQSVVASFLPLSHIFERTVNYTCMAIGASIWYIEDRKSLLKSMQTISPNFITCVPKVLEKNYSIIQAQIRSRPFFIRKLLNWALSSGKKYSESFNWSPVYFIKKLISELILYRKWRLIMGGKLKYVGVGGAALNPALGKLYSNAGIQIREGYGMTECSPVISFNRFEPGGLEFGTVGIPIPGVEVHIDQPDESGIGEVLVKGPNLMLGYFKNPELTAELVRDGWFHTGDLGQFVSKRFLKISGRIKGMFKTTSGRYVVPERLELFLDASPLIEHSFVFGDGKAYVSALIAPDFHELKDWSGSQNVHWTAPQYMVLNPRVEALYQSLIDSINKSLKTEEQIKKFHLVHDKWSVETGELTPTQKIRRKQLRSKYKKEMSDLYK